MIPSAAQGGGGKSEGAWGLSGALDNIRINVGIDAQVFIVALYLAVSTFSPYPSRI